MKKRIIKYLLFCFIIFINFSFASQDELLLSRGKAGTGAEFLNSSFEPYGISTGGVLVSTADSIESIFWNPAGLASLTGTRILLGGSKLTLDRYFSYISFAKPVGENSDKGFGITLLNSYTGDIISYDENGIKGKNIYYMGNSLILSYSRPIDIIKLGLNVKILNEIIEKSYSYGASLDFGLLVTPPLPVQIGITVKNLPGFVQWKNESKFNTIENIILISLGYKSFSGNTKIGLTFLNEKNEDESYLNLGAEFAVTSFLDLRFGIMKGNFSAGAGINFNFMRINYAFWNEGLLEINEYSNMISTVFMF